MVTATRWVLGAVAVGVALAAGAPAGRADDPKPKAGAKDPRETEPKELKTVGDLVKFCLIPTMEH